MEVYVVVDDVPFTRLTAPLFDDDKSTRYLSDLDPGAVEQDIPRGSTVTLIAVEFRGVTSTSILDEEPSAVEFVGFEGDFDDTPEAGVATVTMNRDKSVTAVYRRMPRFVIRRHNENNAERSGGCFDFTLVAAPLLSTPGIADISGMTEVLCAELSGFVKTGTRLTFTAVDDSGCDPDTGVCTEQFHRWEGSAESCGSERTCVIVVEEDIDATAVWRDATP